MMDSSAYKFRDFSKCIEEADKVLRAGGNGPPSPSSLHIFLIGSFVGVLVIIFLRRPEWELLIPIVISGLLSAAINLEERRFQKRRLRLAQQFDEQQQHTKDVLTGVELENVSIEVAGDTYFAGEYAKAYKQLKPLAEQGDSKAQSHLGHMYLNGDFVNKNYVEAASWLTRAAIQGDFSAQDSLGKMYRDGLGVQQNYPEAAKWYRMAAEQGVGYAQANLSTVSFNMNDKVEGLKWLYIAAISGNTSSRRRVALIEEHLTPDQIAEAQRLAREWTANHPTR